MKILVVQDYLRSGGTERQSVLMAQLFRKAGRDVTLLTFRPGGIVADTVPPVRHLSLQPFDTRLDWWAPNFHRVVQAEAPEVVLCMGRMANCWAGGLQLYASRKKLPILVVATMRTGKNLPRLFRRGLHRVSHLVGNSEDAKNTLISRYGVLPGNVTVIHNALVFPAAKVERTQEREKVRAEFGAEAATVVLLWVGMFRPEKNQQAMVEIAARLSSQPNWQLWFAGDGPTRERVRALAEKRGLASRVKFLGFRENPSSLYRAADIAVLTSRSESLSNFLIEAHAHGLPSVAYQAAGVTECGGISVPAEDSEAFVAAISPLLRNAEARAVEGVRVAAYARDKFAPETQAKKYLALFDRLVSTQ